MVEFQSEEQPGISVFYQDKPGDIFHTYSSYARGGDLLLGAYNYLDLTPLGRQEEKGHGMDWVRHHDRYEARRRLGGWRSRSDTPYRAAFLTPSAALPFSSELIPGSRTRPRAFCDYRQHSVPVVRLA